MKFVIVILFATMGDLYVFTEPSFETKNECVDEIQSQNLLNMSRLPYYNLSILVIFILIILFITSRPNSLPFRIWFTDN